MKELLDYRIIYYANRKLNPYSYVNFDFAGNKNIQRSTEGNVFFVASGPVSWETKWQEMVIISTIETEYIAFIQTTQQIL